MLLSSTILRSETQLTVISIWSIGSLPKRCARVRSILPINRPEQPDNFWISENDSIANDFTGYNVSMKSTCWTNVSIKQRNVDTFLTHVETIDTFIKVVLGSIKVVSQVDFKQDLIAAAVTTSPKIDDSHRRFRAQFSSL